MPSHLLSDSFFQNIWSWLDRLDGKLFMAINTRWTNPFFDRVLPWFREPNAWIPLYLFLILLGLMNFGRKFWWWLLFAVATVVLTDQLSSHLIKPLFARPRPCHTYASQVRLLIDSCSNSFSFTSSHATNHFGFAVFLIVSLKNVFGNWRYIFLLWAAAVSYGQVYVGIHYPLDIFCGALIGSATGYLGAIWFNRKFGAVTLS